MTIVRYEPWALVSRLHRQFERALTDTDGADSARVSWIPHVDIHEEAGRFVVVADVPGVEGKDIEVTADKGVLTIKAERRSENKSTRKTATSASSAQAARSCAASPFPRAPTRRPSRPHT